MTIGWRICDLCGKTRTTEFVGCRRDGCPIREEHDHGQTHGEVSGDAEVPTEGRGDPHPPDRGGTFLLGTRPVGTDPVGLADIDTELMIVAWCMKAVGP